MMRSIILGLWVLAGTPALAVDPGEVAGSVLDEARALIAAGDYAGAIPLLREVVTVEETNADAFNLLGFAHRKLGELDVAGGWYRRALEIDPDHLGALEYQGELFLMLGDLAAARANLDRLTEVCGECPERADLEAAIAEAQ